MVDPATITAAAKAATALLTNENTRKGIGWIIVAVLSPLIVIIAAIAALFSGTAQHNSNAVDLCFNGGYISSKAPAEFRQNVMAMQASFAGLDSAIAEINGMAEDGQVDAIRIKSIYYSLFFGSGGSTDSRVFADCFVRYEEREREVTIETVGGDGEITTETTIETYIVAIPLTSLLEIYSNLESALGRGITVDEKNNAAEIYRYIMYGGNIPTFGIEYDDWLSGLALSSVPFIGADGFCSPLGEKWRGMVTSEFGYRRDPFTGERKGHAGIDLGASKGTPIRAALDGKVCLVRYSTTGYGYHVMIDHGGGFTTMYAHCSKILVYEGQEVSAGDIIAHVGSTGRSTGSHLHFEVMINGEKQNPRSYLP
jgi:murein DD-endopeptidase MepM/ murein hydrolase activator NlpD